MAAVKKTPPMELLNDLEPMLTRLKLTAIRDQLDTLLDQAGRAELNLREGLATLCESSTVCCITATSSRSAATATACERRAALAWLTRPARTPQLKPINQQPGVSS